MLFRKYLFFSLILGALADWSTDVYDAIVVGAGPAGIIVAQRMAAAGRKTLLIEGGGLSYGVTGGNLDSRRPSWLNGTALTRVDVPGLFGSIFSSSSGLLCGSLVNSPWLGCTIGGCSAVNAGLFFEPPASDFDLYFPTGWKSADMAASIQRLYANQPSTNLPSQDGIRYLQSGYNVVKQWLVTGLGFSSVDINGLKDNKTQVFGYPAYDYSNGQRGGPVTTYLQQALALSNFYLQSGTRVVRVQRNLGRATGVVVLINGAEQVVQVSNCGRVILSAGALQSPALLMFSGIGDPAVLSTLSAAGKLGGLASSNWINSTAVGSGLFDNPSTFIELRSSAITAYAYSYDSPLPADETLYLQQRSGPYSFAGITSVIWDTLQRSDGSVASFQGSVSTAGQGAYQTTNDITLNIYGTSGMKSRGKVVLDNNFIPGPDGNVYYSDPLDADNIATFIYKIFQGLPAAGITPLNLAQNSTHAQIVSYITSSTIYTRQVVDHWTSSCAIGTCVDVNTVVVGMNNLHVVDASILAPLTVNPQFGIMAAAERASELILSLSCPPVPTTSSSLSSTSTSTTSSSTSSTSTSSSKSTTSTSTTSSSSSTSTSSSKSTTSTSTSTTSSSSSTSTSSSKSTTSTSTTSSSSSTSTSSSKTTTSTSTTSSSSSTSTSSSKSTTSTSTKSSSSSTSTTSSKSTTSTSTTSSSSSTSTLSSKSTTSTSTTSSSPSTSTSSSKSTTSTSTSTTSSTSTSTTQATTSSAAPLPGWTALGCYTDTVANRTLSLFKTVPGGGLAMTIEACLTACRNAGYTFAGVEYSKECYCDNVVRPPGGPAPGGNTSCNLPCKGNATEICGGSLRLDLFKYG